MEWTDEYEKLVNRMNTPRVVIDNGISTTARIVKVDSARKHGVLLDAVQALTDLSLSINKAYISSDGRWFMDVFHVTDRHGRKLNNDSILSFIENAIGAGEAGDAPPAAAPLTALELTGNDRPGLLSDIFAVLSDQRCRVVDAKIWTHNSRIASLIFIADEETGSPICDTDRIHGIKARLRNVVKGDANNSDSRGATATVSAAAPAHADRRLHQMMFADRSNERSSLPPVAATVSVASCIERGYSVVSVQCKVYPKLLFDVVCTLTDMKYVVFHATMDTNGEQANQEFYIRHSDGSFISSEAERQSVIQCLRAAIERRSFEGLILEMTMSDRKGLLTEICRTLRENGLSVTMAEVSVKDGIAVGEFHVTDAAGHPADLKIIQAVIDKVGADCLKLTEQRCCRPSPRRNSVAAAGTGVGLFYLGSFVKKNLYNLGFIRSCS